jgi:heme exporter protein A
LQASNFSGISVRGIEVWRGERRVLAGVSLEAGAGECVHVLGPNGSGKTTLLRVIAGLLLPEAGQVACNGRDTRADRDAWCAAFSYLAHSDGLKPEFTAGENLAFEVGLHRRVSQAEIEGALADLGVAHARDRLVATLSAGQRRRVAFARIMLAGAPLWILDEPYTNLDRDGSVFVSAIIGRHLDAGGAALIAAHMPPAIPGHRPRNLELGA